MNYLLDTCVVSDFFKKIPSVIAHFKQHSPKQLYLSTISVMEVEYGLFLNKERELKIRPLWEVLLENIQIVPLSELSARAAATLRAQLKIAGAPIGPYDILLAGTALAHNFTLVTSNMHEFKRIPEIIAEDWRIN